MGRDAELFCIQRQRFRERDATDVCTLFIDCARDFIIPPIIIIIIVVRHDYARNEISIVIANRDNGRCEVTRVGFPYACLRISIAKVDLKRNFLSYMYKRFDREESIALNKYTDKCVIKVRDFSNI